MTNNLCIETICVENRTLKRAGYHNARLNKTRKDLWGLKDSWDLTEMMSVPDYVGQDRHKLRIVYGEKIEDVRWEKHVPRTIKSIKIVYSNEVDYSHKYNDRTLLSELYEQRGYADEILIIKDGMVTDSFYSNVAFFNGEEWLTPVTNLLPGTQRAFLLDAGIIQKAVITEQGIFKFTHIRLFNALTDWETAPELEVGMIG